MTGDRDPGLDALLGLDGEVFVIDADGHSVKFVVKRVPISAERPHGLSYSLTLHDARGQRLVGFDNAHPAPRKKGRGRRRPQQDHRHRLKTVRPYEYRDASALLADFWTAVESVLKERGGRS
jgi:Family of unknown function (DUF6516)